MTTKSTVLILGASRGLGLAMAEEWLKRDAKVIATQRSASRDLSELQGRYPGSLEIETVDIVEAASVRAPRRAPHRRALRQCRREIQTIGKYPLKGFSEQVELLAWKAPHEIICGSTGANT
jgi:NAD(P)-dependent dehydrogenase (short-subunit alcohol dehydrogenase family)